MGHSKLTEGLCRWISTCNTGGSQSKVRPQTWASVECGIRRSSGRISGTAEARTSPVPEVVLAGIQGRRDSSHQRSETNHRKQRKRAGGRGQCIVIRRERRPLQGRRPLYAGKRSSRWRSPLWRGHIEVDLAVGAGHCGVVRVKLIDGDRVSTQCKPGEGVLAESSDHRITRVQLQAEARRTARKGADQLILHGDEIPANRLPRVRRNDPQDAMRGAAASLCAALAGRSPPVLRYHQRQQRRRCHHSEDYRCP